MRCQNIGNMFFRFVTKHACDGRTDWLTDGQNCDSQDRASTAASLGEKGKEIRSKRKQRKYLAENNNNWLDGFHRRWSVACWCVMRLMTIYSMFLRLFDRACNDQRPIRHDSVERFWELMTAIVADGGCPTDFLCMVYDDTIRPYHSIMQIIDVKTCRKKLKTLKNVKT